MFRNYFRTAWRNLRKYKAYSLINIIGLAVGIATCLIIFLVISYENSYDQFQPRKDRIYRVVTTYKKRSNAEVAGYESAAPIPLAKTLRVELPQLEKTAAVWNIGGAQVHVPIPGKDISEEKRFKENSGLYFAEPGLFEMFDYEWLDGNARSLTEPNTAVLTQSLADNYFGSWKNAVGRTIQLWSFRIPLKIVGVFKDLPANTEMQVRLGGSYATFVDINGGWSQLNNFERVIWPSECFVLAPEKVAVSSLQAQLPRLVKKYYGEDERNTLSISDLSFQPLTSMHLDERFYTFKGDALSHKELWALGLIGVFLLLVACVNFINLATAQSVNRSKEIGVRKVVGSNSTDILKQFLNETALITVIALTMAYILTRLAFPLVERFMQKPFSVDMQHWSVLAFLAGLGIVVTFLAGFYPGVVLARFNPVEAIKNRISNRTVGGSSLRRGLVVFQFVIAQLLIIGTVVVIRQMHFFRNQPMGFEKNAIAFIEMPSDSTDQLQHGYLKSKMLQIPGVEAASYCMDAPASLGSNNTSFFFDNRLARTDFVANFQFADTGYLNTFHMKLVAGRAPYNSDTLRELMVNETLVKKLGLSSPQQILGKMLSFDGDKKHPVVGVFHDFNSKPLRDPVSPMIVSTLSRAYNFIALRMDPHRMQATLAQVHSLFTKTFPTYIYDLSFLDDRIDHFYESEARAAQLFKIAAFFAILISCMGLYGLVSFMAVQKTKEVGIRKVLGASVPSIIYLFSKEFTLLIGIAFLIAAPLGYFFMNKWLTDFHYHVNMGWTVFVLTIVLSIFIAWITVGYKAVKAAWANPVKSLRTE